MHRLVFSMLLGLILTSPAWAQVKADTTAAEEDLEAVLEDLEDAAVDPTQLVEMLGALAENPLDINAATAAELAQIPALGPALAHAIVRFREAFGLFASIAALRAVEGVTVDVFLGARPYLTVGATVFPEEDSPSPYPPRPSLSQILSDLHVEAVQRVTRRLDLGRGFDDDTTRTTYAGSPERVYTRFSVRARDHLSLNVTLEKDPGEAFAWDPETQTYGYDHLTAHAAMGDFGRLERLVVGDFTASFGQGVALWRSSAFGKGREPVRPLVRFGGGLVPYGSTEENRFLRGLAATMRVAPGLDVTALASRRSLDAGLATPDTTSLFGNLPETTGLRDGGLHRTPTEQAAKDAVREDLMGGAVEYERGRARVGVAGYRSWFDRPFEASGAPYEQFNFSGTRASIVSAFGSAYLGEALLFGEAARSESGPVGGLGGALLRIGREAEMVVLARHYPRDFVSLHGHAFGERSGVTQNETGFYLGLQLRPALAWRFSGYFDQYRFPWLRFGVPRPSTGYDALVVARYQPRRWMLVYVQLRSETKEVGTSVEKTGHLLDAVQPETRQSARLHGNYTFSPRLRLRARAEIIRYAAPSRADDYGFLLYQDVRWLPTKPLHLDLRLAVFDTDSFDARVFAYENDLLYTFALPAFSGRGQRAYVLARWQLLERLTLQAKYSVTRFEDAETVGSGLDEADSNRLREVRVQLRYRW